MSEKVIENNKVSVIGRGSLLNLHSAMRYLERAFIW